MEKLMALLITSYTIKDINLPIVLIILASMIYSPFAMARAFSKIKSKRKNKK